MRFNPDHSLFRFMNTAVQFIFLNAFFILLCLPVVTIGWASSALYTVMLKHADDERGYLITGYFEALRDGWKRPSAIYILLGLPFIFLIASSAFWFSLETILSTIVGLLAIMIACYFYILLNYSLALTARYDNKIKQTIKNAILLSIAEPVLSLGNLLIIMALIAFIILFPTFRIFFVFFGFVFSFYCQSFLILSVFKRH